MNIYYSEEHYQHQPPFEIFDGGEKVPNFEVPERAERILHSLNKTSWAHITHPDEHGIKPILAVHKPDYLRFLSTAYQEWLQTETETVYDKTALLPASFPQGKWRNKPKGLLGKAGYYISDLSAPITSGTYPAAVASANCALSGAKLIATGSKTSFALCRPPGHHAGKASCAGYCYINNTAVAANWLAPQGKTAILDIDYHAGNGTQDIFYQRSDVLTISIHADPNYEYPYFAGYANQTGARAGLGFHRNFPLPAGTTTKTYLEALKAALDLITQYDAEFLVISAGMDIYEGDPLGKFKINQEGIYLIGQAIASMNLKNLVVMEGGYNNEALGENITLFLNAFV